MLHFCRSFWCNVLNKAIGLHFKVKPWLNDLVQFEPKPGPLLHVMKILIFLLFTFMSLYPALPCQFLPGLPIPPCRSSSSASHGALHSLSEGTKIQFPRSVWITLRQRIIMRTWHGWWKCVSQRAMQKRRQTQTSVPQWRKRRAP